MDKVKIYGFQNRPPRRRSVQSPENRTQQHMRNECNINSIMERYQKTGILTDPLRTTNRKPMFDGVHNQNATYHDMCNDVLTIQENFSRIPARIRKRFGNDPDEMMAFLSDEKNRPEAEAMGLIDPLPKNPNKQAPEPKKEEKNPPAKE